MRASTWGLMLLVGCKATIADAPPDAHIGDGNGSGSDGAMIDGTLPLGPWGTPQKIPQASTAAAEDDVTLSSSTLEMIFAIVQANGTKDLYYSSRQSVTGTWTTAVPVPFNTTTSEETPRFSTDDKTLYFASGRASGNGTLDIFQITRTGLDNTSWGATPTQVPGENSAVTEKWFMPCGPSGYYLEVRANGANGTDFYEGTLGGSAPTLVPALNSASSEISTFMTPDCTTLYFASARVNPEGIFIAHRNDPASPWQAPTQVTDFAGLGGNQEDPYVSNDSRTFVFASDAAGNKDIYISTR